MSTATRLASFGTVLALVFGGAWGLGSAVGPAQAPAVPAADHGAHAGHLDPAEPPVAPERVWQGEGYQVRLDGELVPRTPTQVFATVSRDGFAVDDLQPHAGAFGHLLAVRSDDDGGEPASVVATPDATAPAETARSGPGIAFVLEVPSAGTYRLYLEFQHGGTVFVASFTIPTRTAP